MTAHDWRLVLRWKILDQTVSLDEAIGAAWPDVCLVFACELGRLPSRVDWTLDQGTLLATASASGWLRHPRPDTRAALAGLDGREILSLPLIKTSAVLRWQPRPENHQVRDVPAS